MSVMKQTWSTYQISSSNFFPADCVSSIYLCPSSDAGAHFMSLACSSLYRGRYCTNNGRGPIRAMSPFQYVEKLRQFVNGGGTDYFPMGSFVSCRVKVSATVFPVIHGFKLDDPEYFSVLSRTFLKEKMPLPCWLWQVTRWLTIGQERSIISERRL